MTVWTNTPQQSMIPRFSNPHFLLQSTKVITRAELEENAKDFPEKDVEQLRQLLDNFLPTWNVSEIRSNNLKETVQVEEEPVLFRLISSTLPALPVYLHPPRPPAHRTQDPEAEDNELQADRRKKRAEAAAINVEDILSRIGLTKAPESKISRAVASIPDPAPHLMIVQRRQLSRKTRPPISSSELMHHPYISGSSSPLNTIKAKCPNIDAQFEVPKSSPRKGRRRRRWKEALPAKERPPAQYYRPNFRWEGKCRGYGYGYPSSFAMAEGYDHTVYWKYERDTIK